LARLKKKLRDVGAKERYRQSNPAQKRQRDEKASQNSSKRHVDLKGSCTCPV
jgi:hypothetical protein